MKLPQLYDIKKGKSYTQVFRGYNHNERIYDGEFYDMDNMTTDNYPILTTRKKNRIADGVTFEYVSGMTVVNDDVYFFAKSSEGDGISLYKNGNELSGRTFSMSDKKVTLYQALMIIFPDKVYYNTMTGEFSDMETVYNVSDDGYAVKACDELFSNVDWFDDTGKYAWGITTEIDLFIEYEELDDDDERQAERQKRITAIEAELTRIKARLQALASNPTDAWYMFVLNKKLNKMWSGYEIVAENLSADNLSDGETNRTTFYDMEEDKLYHYEADSNSPDREYVWTERKLMSKIYISGVNSATSNRFLKYDIVDISGNCDNDYPNLHMKVRKSGLNGKNIVIYDVGTDEIGDYIVIDKFVFGCDWLTDAGAMIKRPVPDLDFVKVHKGRLWGVRFGENKDGVFENLILASAPADSNGIQGTNNFSVVPNYDRGFYANVGSNDEFTALCEYSDYLYAFKENCAIRISGDTASSFRVDTVVCDGVALGSSDSVCEYAGFLYYLSQHGVCRFNGVYADNFSADVFGDIRYTNGISAASGSKYYISVGRSRESLRSYMKRVKAEWIEENRDKYRIPTLFNLALMAFELDAKLKYLSQTTDRCLFVYDMRKGLWTKENNKYTQLTADRGCIYAINSDHKFCLVSVKDHPIEPSMPNGFTEEPDFSWFVETGNIGYDYAEDKYISRIVIRTALSKTSSLTVHIQYDSSDKWEQMYTIRNVGTRSFSFNIIPRRCDHFKLKISGHGECKIYSVQKQTATVE